VSGAPLRAAPLLLAALLALVARPALAADAAELRALRTELAALKLRLTAAEARLAQLEAAADQAAVASAPTVPAVNAPAGAPTPGQLAPASASPTSAAPAPVGGASGYDRKAWRQIKAGTAQAEVLRLLGEPTRRMSMAGRTAWYYRYPDAGPGSVFFNDGGTVSSLQSP
jgi:hypothetical protein